MKIKFDHSVMQNEPGFTVGFAIVSGVTVKKAEKPLKKEIMAAITKAKQKHPSRSAIYSSLPIQSMRDLFKRNGIDPSKYAPSAEALLKRIVDGKDIYRINNVVECNNLGSITYELPMGVYDLSCLAGDVTFAFGTHLDVMDTMAKGKMSMSQCLLTKDSDKLFGSPISDSPHAMITEDSEDILLLVYGPREVGKDYVAKATRCVAEHISMHAQGTISEQGVVLASGEEN